MHPDKPLKALFNRQQEWLTFLNKHIGHVREAVIENVREERDWRHFLDSQYQRYWKVHFAKKTDNILQTVSYLGRYLKRPPVSASRLRHYSKGGMLTFDYLNHRTGQIESLTLPLAALIERLVEHIPDKGFKMIRYYGFFPIVIGVRCCPKCMTP